MRRTTQPKRVSDAETAEIIKKNFIERARDGLFNTPYPGYPKVRYVSSDPTDTVVPEGEWTLHNDHVQNLTEEQVAELLESDIAFNSEGKPIHPWLSDMIADPGIGVVGGPGAYWNDGPNRCSDNIPISRLFRRVLLIKRGDTGSWALAGGFRDKNTEDPFNAARRELIEETGLSRFINIFSRPVLIYAGIVADKRTTATSWAHTHAVLTRPLLPWPHVNGADDATRAKWFKLDKLPADFFGSHSILVDLAIDYIDGNVIIE